MNKNIGIYALVENRAGHELFGQIRYIGQSRDIVSRLRYHVNKSKNNKHGNPRMANLINAHLNTGNTLHWKTLVICSVADLDYYEIKLIEAYRSHLVNVSDGGTVQDCIQGGLTGGKKTHKLKLGVHAMSTAERKALGQRLHAQRIGCHALTKLELQNISLKNKLAGKGIFSQSSKDLIKIGIRARDLKTGVHAMSNVELSTYGRKGGKTAGNQAVINKTGIHALSVEDRNKFAQFGADKLRDKAEQEYAAWLVRNELPNSYKVTRTEAKKHDLKRYFGKTCDKHPEAGGMRLLSNAMCVYCLRK